MLLQRQFRHSIHSKFRIGNVPVAMPSARTCLLSNPNVTGEHISIHLSSHNHMHTLSKPQGLKKQAWIISAGNIGKDNGAISLARLLNLEPVIKHIIPSQSIRWIFPALQLRFLNDANSEPPNDQMEKSNPSTSESLPWYLHAPTGHDIEGECPSAVMSSCADTILAALLVKKVGQGKSKAIHLFDPLADVQYFDACLIPKHLWPTIGTSVPNELENGVYRTDGYMNLISQQYLETVSVLPIDESFRIIQADRHITVLISGEPSHSFAWYSDHTNRLSRQLSQLLTIHNVKIMLSFSPQTPLAISQRIMEWYSNLEQSIQQRVYCLKGQDPAEYAAALALSTDIIVFADSPLKTSEAICSGEFHQAQIAAKRIRILKPAQWEVDPGDHEDALCEDVEYSPLSYRFGFSHHHEEHVALPEEHVDALQRMVDTK
ncbi:hypothetical protein BASA50_002964 [Batrachochytrium salamandrivorans]|uniref:Uncharacterized protein n=1 Tax=Batrachochytrium salamandrivorans TaxID=1357716 RepID=A0ABQ8FN36_9FUNG|nr:hypothetical protein BASA61_006250 [Batrachochytrium salamandrivorans]KAH6599622.1 hypothetical protein BASA50_002964 [Batrachochytrium salamandrivorans]KAH9268028.1 hypothetical protein BASA84_000496 [Batrachochytrium salamandrivorans]